MLEAPVAPPESTPREPDPGRGQAPARLPVLVIAPQPFYEDRGTCIAIRQVIEALDELGHPVDLVTYPLGREIALPQLRIHRSANPFRVRTVPIGFSLRKILLDVPLALAVRERLRRRRYLCIHAVEEASFIAVPLGRLLGVPTLYDMQSSLPEQMSQSAFFRWRPVRAALGRAEEWVLRHADLVVSSSGLAPRVQTVAPRTRVMQWQYAAVPPARSPNGSAELRRQLRIPPAAPIVLYSGTFEEYQGLPELLGAVPRVLEAVPETVFVLVGEGSAGSALARLASELLPPHALRFVPRQPRTRMPHFLAMADILVSPRSAQGGNLPLKIFDYLAAGRPILATDVPAHRTVLDESRACLAEPTAAGLGAAAVQLLKDAELRRRLREGAARYAEANLSWLGFVQSVGAIYSEIGRCAGRSGLPAA